MTQVQMLHPKPVISKVLQIHQITPQLMSKVLANDLEMFDDLLESHLQNHPETELEEDKIVIKGYTCLPRYNFNNDIKILYHRIQQLISDTLYVYGVKDNKVSKQFSIKAMRSVIANYDLCYLNCIYDDRNNKEQAEIHTRFCKLFFTPKI